MTAPSISGAFRPPIELNSIPSEGAADWSTANCAIPAGRLESRRTATRVTPGATSRISSSHFPLMPYSIDVKPVALPPGCARLWTKPAPTGSGVSVNTIGTVRVACSNDPATAPAASQDDVRRERKELGRVFANALGIARPPARVDLDVAGDGPARLPQPLQERGDAGLPFRILRGRGHEHADAPHPLALRARRERVRRCCAAEQR